MAPLRIILFAVFSIFALSSVTPVRAQTDTNSMKAEMDAAIHQVEKIVNQTVPAYRRAAGMHVGTFKPGWFHEGAMKPDFNNVDVRVTRETAEYDKTDYCTSDINPGLVWKSRDLEFNSMTKYFYTNRTFPKKRLSEAEMLEINRLYRIIGKCEGQLNPAPKAEGNSDSDAEISNAPEKRKKLLNPYIGIPIISVLALLLIVIYKRKS